ncbi:hypothetical protein C8A05DRAFT_14146 [Staphylotrichum tortipilum]|uniref:BHLH domain-containing protein n=1 Tax=Staphylotrichum tortipilum TaxID=2831512 RepID=A0AAN6MN35_9PEZI|nr:hypothetical protein C8A05DRAFT_14146 [Staphylotrichum longicolle]
MAGLDANSPSLFASLDGTLGPFDIGDGSLDGSNLGGDLMDRSPLGNPESATTTGTSLLGDTPASAAGSGLSGTVTVSPPAVAAASQPQQQQQPQPDFFAQAAAPQWPFQDNPPYGPNQNPFGPVPQQTWELPLNLNQPLQQQQPSFHLGSAAPANNPNFVLAPAGNVPLTSPFPLDPQSLQPENLRNIQNTLTPAQRERLRSIAMPPHLQYHSPQSAAGSPDSASSGHEKPLSSPDAADPSKANRKRKPSADVDDDDDDDDLDHPVKKTAHNMIEKRYRTNLNDKIAALRDSVPSLRIMSKSARGEDTTEDREELHGLTPAHKLNKATVLSKATEYIRHLEKRNNRLLDENSSMQARIAAFEKLFMAGAMTGQIPNPLQQAPTPMQFTPDATTPFLNTPMATPRGPDPPGMIPIPDDMKRILAAQQMNAGRPYPVPAQQFGQNPAMVRQQQIQQQHQQAQSQAGRWNPYLGKLMVGSLAGLMLVEALVEKEPSSETTDARGLSFLPPAKLVGDFVRSTHFSIGGYFVSGVDVIAKLRLLSLLGFVVWLACSSFFDSSVFRPSKKPKTAQPVVKAVPSLASPIHVRRQAWLTAIQTVWVPRHNFFLEAAALMLKTLKYTLRNVIGSHAYLALTGLSEEQEAARVKAWSIALDAQLAGGDVEINKSRLTLTLIASGTLPDTPLRLMLKALHIRVLLWRLNGVSWAANMIAAQLARSRWNEARQLNRILNSLSVGDACADDTLPEYLAALLEQDCDDVLNDTIVERANNLAWNQLTTHNVVDKIDGMDAVVDDPAVRSPMDAVAAWYSNLTTHRALVDSLRNARYDAAATPTLTDDSTALAVQIAPIGSNAQARALVARCVLSEKQRGANIAAAMQALGPTANPLRRPQYITGLSPVLDSPITAMVPDADAQMALRGAMGIAQLRRYANPPPPAYLVIDSVLPAGADAGAGGMALLGYTAAFHLMGCLDRHTVARETCSSSLERLAGGLRIWIGSESAGGEASGVDAGMRREMIEQCLAVTKSVVGMEADPGYGSMDECVEGVEGGGC